MDISLYDFLGYAAIAFCVISWGNWFRVGYFYRGGFQITTQPLLWTILMFNVLAYIEKGL